MNPFRGICFQQANNFRARPRGWSPNQDMDMINGSIDDQRLASDFAYDPAEIGVQVVLDFARDERCAPFGAEYQVDQQIGSGVSQVFRPFRASLSHPPRGLRPGLYSGAASRLTVLFERGRPLHAVSQPTSHWAKGFSFEHF